jgi:tungstate transport system ATP-binding protein
MTYIYEFENVTKQYGENTAVADLTFKIEETITAIIGYSGAGKTTLLKMLAGLETPTFGTIRYNGIEVTSRNLHDLRRRVTMLFQDPVFFNLSVEDNVVYGLRRRGVNMEEALRRGKRVLTSLGLEGFEKRKAAKLSGGEQQRVALARALVIEPRVLLLDEPTSDLDPTNTRVILDLIKDFSKKAPVIIATHDFRHVIELADRIVVLIKGELRQYDSPHKIFYEPQSRDVADFVGIENIFQGQVISNEMGVATVKIGQQKFFVSSIIDRGEVDVYVRPENVILSPNKLKSSARNNIQGKIVSINPVGPVLRVTLDNGLSAFITKQSLEEFELHVGKKIFAAFKATAAHLSIK